MSLLGLDRTHRSRKLTHVCGFHLFEISQSLSHTLDHLLENLFILQVWVYHDCIKWKRVMNFHPSLKVYLSQDQVPFCVISLLIYILTLVRHSSSFKKFEVRRRQKVDEHVFSISIILLKFQRLIQ